jgi:hypothetical protein
MLPDAKPNSRIYQFVSLITKSIPTRTGRSFIANRHPQLHALENGGGASQWALRPATKASPFLIQINSSEPFGASVDADGDGG